MRTPESVTRGPRLVGTAASVVKGLYLARSLRDFGDGFVAVLLPVYLAALGLDVLQIGIVATAALLGSACLTLAIGWFGTRRDHRKLLVAASGLMVATGLAFMMVGSFVPLLFVAFFGTANPSAGSVSIFVPLEHAVLSRAVEDTARTASFARYSLVGALASAVGSFAAASPDLMAHLGISSLMALRLMFMTYALLGLGMAWIYAHVPVKPETGAAEAAGSGLGPSRRMVYRLAGLFSIDWGVPTNLWRGLPATTAGPTPSPPPSASPSSSHSGCDQWVLAHASRRARRK